MSRRKAGIESAEIAQRQIVALELRKSGYSYRRIAVQLEISHQQAWTDVNSELKRLSEISLETAGELRQMELERLDMGIKGVMPFIEAGSAPHAMALVKLISEKARLLGLYAPEKVEMKVSWEDQAIADIKAGNLTYKDLSGAFDSDLATRLFTRAGIPVSSGESTGE